MVPSELLEIVIENVRKKAHFAVVGKAASELIFYYKE